LEKITESKPVEVNGGIGFNSSFYNAVGMPDRNDPFNWMLSAQLNFKLFGIIDAPFSANFTNQNKTFNQPSFNQYGISPKYKDITVHLGYRNMSFSNYTLSGLTFFGLGVEYKPQSSLVKLAVMYGRFAKAINIQDSIQYGYELPAYERWGYGTKISVGRDKHNVDFILFKARDDEKSIRNDTVIFALKPKENLVLGLATKNQLGSTTIQFSYSISAFTSDTRTPDYEFETYTYVNNLGPFYSPKLTSSIKKVFDAKVNYQGTFYSLGVSFKRVDPEYQSLGALYMTNDIQDVLGNGTLRFLQNKINISGSFGVQKNNLDDKLLNNSRRVIGNVSFSFAITQNLNISANYSNFSSSTLPTQLNFIDSVEYIQVTTNRAIMVNYSLNNEEIKQNFMFNLNNQKANNLEVYLHDEHENVSLFNNLVFSYRIEPSKLNTAFTASMNYNEFKMTNTKNQGFAPSIAISKAFFQKKLRSQLSYAWVNSWMNEKFASQIHTLRLNNTIAINKMHSFRVFANIVIKRNKDKERGNSVEERCGITYNLNF